MILHHQRLDPSERGTLELYVEGSTKTLKFGLDLPNLNASWLPFSLLSLGGAYHILTLVENYNFNNRAHWILDNNFKLVDHCVEMFVDRLLLEGNW